LRWANDIPQTINLLFFHVSHIILRRTYTIHYCWFVLFSHWFVQSFYDRSSAHQSSDSVFEKRLSDIYKAIHSLHTSLVLHYVLPYKVEEDSKCLVLWLFRSMMFKAWLMLLEDPRRNWDLWMIIDCYKVKNTEIRVGEQLFVVLWLTSMILWWYPNLWRFIMDLICWKKIIWT